MGWQEWKHRNDVPDDDDGDGDELFDQVGLNPTGRKRKSSAGTRRKKDNRLFKGTVWERKKS
jgi:hypothetical protein